MRALVLDGAIDPTISSIDQDKAQAAGFELAFSHFAQACTAKACKLGNDPQQFVMTLMAKAAAHPIPSGTKKDKRTAGDGAVLLGVISALYDQTQWDTLTSALVDANNGDASGILALDDAYNERQPDGTYSNIEDANATIGCADDTAATHGRPGSRLRAGVAREQSVVRRRSGVQPRLLQLVEGTARPADRRRQQERATDPGDRHDRRPGDSDLGRSTTSRRCSDRAGCWCGKATGTPPTPRRRASPTTSTTT